MSRNLNFIGLQTDDPAPYEYLPALLHPTTAGGVTCYLRNLEEHLLGHIGKAHSLVGCVAWLTHSRILDALAHVPGGVNLVVQKEDFLRPDLAPSSAFKERLRRQYGRLKPATSRQTCGTILEGMSCCGDPTIDAIRCVGNLNSEHAPAFPRMHHKFILFCEQTIEHVPADDTIYGHYPEFPDWGAPYDIQRIRPYAVWTGSFNFTENAVASFENALYLTLPPIVNAYKEEWGWIEGLSEPLDWETPWIAPQWRIGT